MVEKVIDEFSGFGRVSAVTEHKIGGRVDLCVGKCSVDAAPREPAELLPLKAGEKLLVRLRYRGRRHRSRRTANDPKPSCSSSHARTAGVTLSRVAPVSLEASFQNVTTSSGTGSVRNSSRWAPTGAAPFMRSSSSSADKPLSVAACSSRL